MWTALVELVLAKKRLFSIAILLTTALALLPIPRLTFDNSLKRFFVPHAPNVDLHEKVTREFGNDGVMVLTMTLPSDEVTREFIAQVGRLTERIEKMDNVERVVSLTTAHLVTANEDGLDIKQLLPNPDNVSMQKLQQIFKEIESSRLLRGELISRDKRSVAIIIYWKSTEGQNERTIQKQLIDRIKALVSVPAMQAYQPAFSGFHVIEAEVDRYSYMDLSQLVPLSLVGLFLTMFLSYRSLRLSFLYLLTAVLPLIWTAGLMSLLQAKLSMVTTLLPVLLITIAIADIIHLHTGYAFELERAKGAFSDKRGKRAAILKTISLIGPPCFLTSLTTAIGFLALLSSEIQPIREFGVFAAIGVSFDFMLTITMVSILFYVLNQKLFCRRLTQRSDRRKMAGLLQWVAAVTTKYSLRVLVVSVLIIGLIALGISRINIETNFIEYLPKESTVYKDTALIERQLSGVMPLTVYLSSAQTDRLKDPDILQKLDSLAQYAREAKEVGQVISMADFVAEVDGILHGKGEPGYESREIGTKSRNRCFCTISPPRTPANWIASLTTIIPKP